MLCYLLKSTFDTNNKTNRSFGFSRDRRPATVSVNLESLCTSPADDLAGSRAKSVEVAYRLYAMSASDPIEYLVRRKFFSNQSGSVVVSRTERLLRKAPEADLQAVKAYRTELMAKSPEELNALYEAELHRDAAEKKAKADLEEQKWFFNHPS